MSHLRRQLIEQQPQVDRLTAEIANESARDLINKTYKDQTRRFSNEKNKAHWAAEEKFDAAIEKARKERDAQLKALDEANK